MPADFYIDDEADPTDYEEIAVEETREECVTAAIAICRIQAHESGEAMEVVVCLNEAAGPCPRRVLGGGCDLCERITVHPDGHVDREVRPA